MRLDNTQLAISKTCEISFNTPENTAGNYEGLPTLEAFFILPKLEKLSDAGRVGKNAATHLCNNYWAHFEASVKDDLDSNVPARLARRALGGNVTTTLVATGVYDHEFAILPPQIGDILPSFDLISVLGAADFLMAGVMVDKFKASQKNADRVQYEAALIGSGKFTNPSAIAMPAQAATPCMDGFKTIVKYKEADNTTVVNLSNLGRIAEWMIEHDNKIRRNKRRTGDPVQTVTGYGSGAHVRSQPRGKYETKIQLVVDFLNLSDWQKSVKNEILNDLSFLVPGEKIATVASVDYFNEVEIIVPKFGFDSPDTAEDEGDATTPINVIAFEDPVTKGTFKMRVRNGNATLI